MQPSGRAARPGERARRCTEALWQSSVCRNCRLRTKSMYCSRCRMSGLMRSSVSATSAREMRREHVADVRLGQVLQARALRRAR